MALFTFEQAIADSEQYTKRHLILGNGFSIFALAAQVDLTAQESEFVKKYKMGKEVIYNKDRVNPEMHDYKSGKRVFFLIVLLCRNVNMKRRSTCKQRIIPARLLC